MTMQAHKPLTRRLAAADALSDPDMDVLNALHDGAETRPPNDRLVEAHQHAPAFLLVEGWAYTFKVLRDGRRQILKVLIPGDVSNPAGLFGEPSRTAVRTLTPASCVALGPEAMDRVAAHDSGLAQRLAWRLGTERVDPQHVVSLGRRNAYERIAHFLVDTWDRLASVGMTNGTHYRLPVKQEHIADFLGLSVVHVSRTLTQLRDKGFARVERGTAKLDDIPGLMAAGDVRPVNPLPAAAEPVSVSAA